MVKNFKDLAAPLYEDGESAAEISKYKQQAEAEVVAHKLGELRRELGVDQVELARRLGMTQGGISKLERSADPKLSTLRKLAEALGGSLRIEVDVDGRTFPLSAEVKADDAINRIERRKKGKLLKANAVSTLEEDRARR